MIIQWEAPARVEVGYEASGGGGSDPLHGPDNIRSGPPLPATEDNHPLDNDGSLNLKNMSTPGQQEDFPMWIRAQRDEHSG
ncbi:hypothetical protein Pmani_019901 [Petrolisthes manimaculis]|uniref:Uncharacterized protein n=1 Tax=Petrolisthes manimaculis TaxID=1843537 RepID=A0AAE1PHA3_9EUCA|nr:hypothetical protein Pmani_019901 [Petrolisthes manimaculis]